MDHKNINKKNSNLLRLPPSGPIKLPYRKKIFYETFKNKHNDGKIDEK